MAAQSTRFHRIWQRTVVVPYRQVLLTEHPAMENFFANRCTHLAGMIAYFGILSIIPAVFLFISTLGLFGYLETQGWVVEQIRFVLPSRDDGAAGEGTRSILRTVDYLRARSSSLGVIGAVGLIWGTSNFLSCIESGLNIVYGVNNRPFLKQKAWVLFLMLIALVCMTLSVVGGALALPLLQAGDRLAESALHIDVTSAVISIFISMFFAFMFLLSCYRFLPNTEVHTSDVWRGALAGSVLFELTVHALPLYLSYSSENVVFQAFAGALILLVWFYLGALILLAGGVVNWWRAEKRSRELG